MTITNNRSKLIISLSACFCLFLLNACYEESTGCLDFTAANYDVSADNNCDEEDTGAGCPCEYNTLDIAFNLMYDTLDYSLNDTIPLSESDTLKVNEGHLILSSFCLTNRSGQIFKTNTSYDINGDGDAIELNDIIVYRFSSTTQSVGELQLRDSLSEISFHQGISDELNDSAFDFSENDAVTRLIDSSYINDLNQIASFRIKYQNIQENDTTDYESILYLDPQDLSYLFPLDTVINYDDNPTLNLSADIALLFQGINLGDSDTDLKLSQNLKNFIAVKE